ncbi:MAG: hypothetical protein GF320_21360 [Armatimonadia bacterium]|nr:hypothetical protein [Armatimonadia bacterium]
MIGFQVLILKDSFGPALRELRSQASQYRDLLMLIGRVAQNHIAEIFANEGPPGDPWPPLSPVTVQQRLRRRGAFAGRHARRMADLRAEERNLKSLWGGGIGRKEYRKRKAGLARRKDRARSAFDRHLGRMASSERILDDTGELKRSLIGDAGAPSAVRRISRDKYFIGTSRSNPKSGKAIGLTHQFGYKHIPRRSFIVVTDAMRRDVAEAARQWLEDRLKKIAAKYGGTSP